MKRATINDLLKLSFSNGEHLLFLRSHLSINIDDSIAFNEWLDYFEHQIATYNDHQPAHQRTIQRAKTIYETTWGLILAVIFLLSLMSIPYLWLLHPNKEMNMLPAIFYFGAAIFFIGKVAYYRLKKRS